MSLRKCMHCGLEAITETDLKLFSYNNTFKYDAENKCRKCKAKISHERSRMIVKRIDVLKNKPCVDCRRLWLSECMDFDHVRGKKLFRVSRGAFHHGWQKILNEIAKCDLVCANCHRVRTRKRQQAGVNAEQGV